MRLAGRITDWNDERRFGFVVPNGGGDRAFVHVNAFQRGSRRPVVGDLVSYLPTRNARGQFDARQIRHARQKIAQPRAPWRVPRAALGIGALALAAALAVIDVIPLVLVIVLASLSLLAYGIYWMDKSAARRGARRTPESTLHLLSLAGGWPGALLAQQHFRHKTIKQPFQSIFWLTVVSNVIALAWLVNAGVADALARSLAH